MISKISTEIEIDSGRKVKIIKYKSTIYLVDENDFPLNNEVFAYNIQNMGIDIFYLDKIEEIALRCFRILEIKKLKYKSHIVDIIKGIYPPSDAISKPRL